MATAHKKTIEVSSHLKALNVLVVDNDRRLTELMSGVLHYLGFKNVYQATDGFSAVNLLYDQDIDIVLTDWELKPVNGNYLTDLPANPVFRTDRWTPVPPKDGACFVKYLRRSRYSPNPYVPVIMMTGI